jgi:N-acyl-L-homoserine lactone synthetase
MERGQTLSAELARDFDLEATDLSPELQLCIARLEELRRREDPVGDRRSRSAKPFLLSVPASNYPIELSILPGINEEICELRYKAYERAGWIDDEAAIISDDFDMLPTSVLVAATSGGRVVGTIRISMKTGQNAAIGLPCEMEFPGKLADVSKSMPDAKLAEFCRVAIDPDITNKSFRATLYGSLVRAAVTVAWASEIDYALVAVHTGISRFYQHMCGFQKLASSRGYGIIKEPTNLLGAEFSELLRRSSKRNGFFHISDEEMVRVGDHLRHSSPGLWQEAAQ